MINNLQNLNKITKNHDETFIINFNETTQGLPEKPKISNHDNYVTEFRAYEEQMQKYFLSSSSWLKDIHKRTGNLTENHKKTYYKLYEEFKTYEKFIKLAKSNFENINQKIYCQVPEDGSMSPSNPCYTIFNDDHIPNDLKRNIINDEFQKFNTDDDYFIKVFFDKLKDIRRYLRKEKRKIKAKKLTKNQKKKLKKKLKSQVVSETVLKQSLTIESNSDEDPQIMIQQFFQQYFSTGKWSWTLWNNCINRIQQNFPQWYELFSVYSQCMGINWNEMFMSDVNAIDNSNVRIDITSLHDTNKDISSTDLFEDSKQGKSVIFTDEIVTIATPEKSTSDLYCDSCQQEFKSKRMFHIHIRGVKHIQNELKHMSNQKPERFLEEINKQNASILSDADKETKHLKWLLTNKDISRETGTFTCTICQVKCSSQKDFNFHLNGDKHKTNSEVSIDTIVAGTNSPPAPDVSVLVNHFTDSAGTIGFSGSKGSKKPVARIQKFLDQCTEALIGVNHVSEYQRSNPTLECWYFCELCSGKLDRRSVIAHLVSYQHRENYLSHNYDDLLDLIKQDPSSKPVRMKRLQVFSEQIEIFEGRKKMNIFAERTSMTEHETPILGAKRYSVLDDRVRHSTIKPDKRKQKFESESVTAKKSKLDIHHDEPPQSPWNGDKEDGEIETSDDDEDPKVPEMKILTSITNSVKINGRDSCPVSKEIPKHGYSELEAGEIENEITENEELDSSDNLASHDTDDIPVDGKPIDIVSEAEFSYYDPVFVNERIQDVFRTKNRIDLIQNTQNRKKIKLKDVNNDILDHFKQQAIWALNRRKQGGSINTGISGNLLLPPSKFPVGPIYPGVSELSTKSLNDNNPVELVPSIVPEDCNQLSCPELEFTNILDKIESITGMELTANRLKGRCDTNDKSLLCDVQNMLVNRIDNDTLNQVVRQELLLESDRISDSGVKLFKKPILNSPLNVKVLNETVEMLKSFPDIGQYPGSSNRFTELTSKNVSGSIVTIPENINFYKMGEKLGKHAEFLGVDQPPPPTNFPKMVHDPYFEQPICTMPVIPPYFTPGMIEHQSVFSNYNNSFLYHHYPFMPHTPNIPPQTSDILNNRNRTSI